MIYTVTSEDEYWTAVKRLVGPPEVFDAQGDDHGHIDGSLQDAIEDVLVPLVGPWEDSEVWFHTTDFWGDGIRPLIFREGDFPYQVIPTLRQLLVGDLAHFCITIQLLDKLYGEDNRTVGAIAIAAAGIVVTDNIHPLIADHA